MEGGGSGETDPGHCMRSGVPLPASLPAELPLPLCSRVKPRLQGGGEGAFRLSQARSLRSCKFLGQMALTSSLCSPRFWDMTQTRAL